MQSLMSAGYGVGKNDDGFIAGTEAARQVMASIQDYPLSVLFVFSSVKFPLERVLAGITSVTGEMPVIGSTTAGEICNGYSTESVVVMGIASPYLSFKAGVGTNVSGDWKASTIVIRAGNITFTVPENLPVEAGLPWPGRLSMVVAVTLLTASYLLKRGDTTTFPDMTFLVCRCCLPACWQWPVMI